MMSAAAVNEHDRRAATEAYVEVLEEEGYWTERGLRWEPTDPSISIIARHIAAAREEGRQEERRRWREWHDGLRKACDPADWLHDWDWIDEHRPPPDRR